MRNVLSFSPSVKIDINTPNGGKDTDRGIRGANKKSTFRHTRVPPLRHDRPRVDWDNERLNGKLGWTESEQGTSSLNLGEQDPIPSRTKDWVLRHFGQGTSGRKGEMGVLEGRNPSDMTCSKDGGSRRTGRRGNSNVESCA